MIVLHQQWMIVVVVAGKIACEICSLQVYPSYHLTGGNCDARKSPQIRLTSSRGSDDDRYENEAVRLLRGKRHYVV